jgi:hypothetical protein
MQIDHEYLRRLLIAFQAARGPLTDIRQLSEAGIQYDDPQFVFHMEILQDKGLVERADGDPGFGLVRGADWNYHSWSVVPLRLTAQGHELLEGLRDPRIWAKIEAQFPTAGIATLITVSESMLAASTTQALRGS